MLPEVVVELEPNPRMERALLPEVDNVLYFMQRSGRRIPAEKEGRLSQIHEASHAVMMVVLCGYACDEIVVGDKARHTRLRSDERSATEGNIDIIDLAGLYGEVRELGDTRCAWQHIQNAFHDLREARMRIHSDSEGEVAWARQHEPIARCCVEWLWPTILAVAAEVPPPPETGKLTATRILDLVTKNLPIGPAPLDLVPRLKEVFGGCAPP